MSNAQITAQGIVGATITEKFEAACALASATYDRGEDTTEIDAVVDALAEMLD